MRETKVANVRRKLMIKKTTKRGSWLSKATAGGRLFQKIQEEADIELK